MEIEITRYQPEWGEELEALQRRYIATRPRGAKLVSKEFYHKHPAMDKGKNVFCAFARGRGLVGYGALIPTPAKPAGPPDIPNTIWIHIRVEPGAGSLEAIQDPIYDAIVARAEAYSRVWEERRTRLAAACPEPRQDEIAYFEAKGLRPFDALLQMGRELSTPFPAVALPVGITARRWLMETPQERAAYVEAEAQVFPHSPRTVEELTFYTETWQGGTPVAAFDAEGKLVGSMMAYWYNRRYGLTEDVFVVPAWRRRGIASYLVTQGMIYLRENGIGRVGLEVRESNTPAVQLYQSLGYQTANREVHLELYLSGAAGG
jgi:ribosomal protein S18 acetylase RimI-like enzyme